MVTSNLVANAGMFANIPVFPVITWSVIKRGYCDTFEITLFANNVCLVWTQHNTTKTSQHHRLLETRWSGSRKFRIDLAQQRNVRRAAKCPCYPCRTLAPLRPKWPDSSYTESKRRECRRKWSTLRPCKRSSPRSGSNQILDLKQDGDIPTLEVTHRLVDQIGVGRRKHLGKVQFFL